jgi:hypothetical protein
VLGYPSICMVTACYNHEEFVGATIQSVLSQGYPDLQYVVINDGSTDDSEQVIRPYAEQLHHFETWPGERPGPVRALNRGFSHTTADIMGWLNSDDLLIPNSLFVVGEVFSQLPEVQWLTGIAVAADEQGRYIRARRNRKNVYDFLAGDWKVIQQESTFWRRGLWDAAGGTLSEEYSPAFDAELWCRFFLHAQHYHLDTLVGAFRKLPHSLSRRKTEEYAGKTEQALAALRRGVPKRVQRRVARYRVHKLAARALRSQRLAGLAGRALGGSEFQYGCISHETATGSWRVHWEW